MINLKVCVIMDDTKTEIKTVDEYISQFPDDIREKLEMIRNTIKEAAPNVKEKISWGMATFYINGNLVHFAANKKHIGFYPSPSGISAFKDRLSNYKHSKGAIQFPYNMHLPIDLIKEIVVLRYNENISK